MVLIGEHVGGMALYSRVCGVSGAIGMGLVFPRLVLNHLDIKSGSMEDLYVLQYKVTKCYYVVRICCN